MSIILTHNWEQKTTPPGFSVCLYFGGVGARRGVKSLKFKLGIFRVTRMVGRGTL